MNTSISSSLAKLPALPQVSINDLKSSSNTTMATPAVKLEDIPELINQVYQNLENQNLNSKNNTVPELRSPTAPLSKGVVGAIQDSMASSNFILGNVGKSA